MIYFINEKHQYGDLGPVTFTFLDQKDVFDEAQESEEDEGVIFECRTKEKLTALADRVESIKEQVPGVGVVKKWRAKRISDFANFIRNSEHVKTTT